MLMYIYKGKRCICESFVGVWDKKSVIIVTSYYTLIRIFVFRA